MFHGTVLYIKVLDKNLPTFAQILLWKLQNSYLVSQKVLENSERTLSLLGRTPRTSLFLRLSPASMPLPPSQGRLFLGQL